MASSPLSSLVSLRLSDAPAGELRLAVELSTVCYSAGHLTTAVLMWLFFLPVYCIGFPLWCLYRVIRMSRYLREQAEHPGSRDQKMEHKFQRLGFLVSDALGSFLLVPVGLRRCCSTCSYADRCCTVSRSEAAFPLVSHAGLPDQLRARHPSTAASFIAAIAQLL